MATTRIMPLHVGKGRTESRAIVSAKYCYVTHELRLHQNDRCKRFTLF